MKNLWLKTTSCVVIWGNERRHVTTTSEVGEKSECSCSHHCWCDIDSLSVSLRVHPVSLYLSIVQGSICAFTIVTGGAARLVFGYDSYGNTCGRGNGRIEGVQLSGLDHTDRK